ncbi:unnamed protein product, partial [Ixodes hexagonus]
GFLGKCFLLGLIGPVCAAFRNRGRQCCVSSGGSHLSQLRAIFVLEGLSFCTTCVSSVLFYFHAFWLSGVGYELCYADLQGKYKKKTCTFPFRDFHVFPYSSRYKQPFHHTVQHRMCFSSFPSRHLRSSALHTHTTESKVRGHMLQFFAT